MSNNSMQFLSTLLLQSPLLLAYVAALVFCAFRWNRYPRPAQLAFLGTLFLLMAALAQPLLTQVILTQFRSNSATHIGEMISITSLISSIVRATGFAFLIGAAFIHRGQTDTRGGFTVSPPLQEPLRR